MPAKSGAPPINQQNAGCLLTLSTAPSGHCHQMQLADANISEDKIKRSCCRFNAAADQVAPLRVVHNNGLI